MNVCHFYVDAKGEWRWHVKAANYRVVSDSGEAYEHKADAVQIAEALFGNSVKYVTDAPPKEV